MSAAMISVGLMRESRFPIRNATAHAYACVTGVATGAPRNGSANGKAREFLRLFADDLD
jgi:hypothetical protein